MSSMAKKRAVFLDRDGVLNRAVVRDGKPYPPTRLEDVEILPGVAEACQRLRTAGFLLIGVTNQPDVARGTQKREVVEAINARLCAELTLDEIRVCYHDDAEHCECRKPKPGLIFEAARDYGINRLSSFLVGDRWRDISAGQQAGCTTIWINAGYTEPGPHQSPDLECRSLLEASEWILTMSDTHNPPAPKLSALKVKIFGDGAEKAGMLELYKNPLIKGFTTNPTLMRKAGLTDYEAFAKEILELIPDRPLSLEVFSDEFSEMKRQALKLAALGKNVYVKIPITNTRNESSLNLARDLAGSGVKLNITALTTLEQVKASHDALAKGPAAYVSVFAGRVADTGRDPLPIMTRAVEILRPSPQVELIWASPRELLNIFQADIIGCHVITVTHDILKKLSLVGKDLNEYSLDTVKMFYDDAQKAGYKL